MVLAFYQCRVVVSMCGILSLGFVLNVRGIKNNPSSNFFNKKFIKESDKGFANII
jgi:hypothetical protein